MPDYLSQIDAYLEANPPRASVVMAVHDLFGRKLKLTHADVVRARYCSNWELFVVQLLSMVGIQRDVSVERE